MKFTDTHYKMLIIEGGKTSTCNWKNRVSEKFISLPHITLMLIMGPISSAAKREKSK
jgi:hypothetical protein